MLLLLLLFFTFLSTIIIVVTSETIIRSLLLHVFSPALLLSVHGVEVEDERLRDPRAEHVDGQLPELLGEDHLGPAHEHRRPQGVLGVAGQRLGQVRAAVLGEHGAAGVGGGRVRDGVVDAEVVGGLLFALVALEVEDGGRGEVGVEALGEGGDDVGAQECVEVDDEEVLDAVGAAVVAGVVDDLGDVVGLQHVGLLDDDESEVDVAVVEGLLGGRGRDRGRRSVVVIVVVGRIGRRRIVIVRVCC